MNKQKIFTFLSNGVDIVEFLTFLFIVPYVLLWLYQGILAVVTEGGMNEAVLMLLSEFRVHVTTILGFYFLTNGTEKVITRVNEGKRNNTYGNHKPYENQMEVNEYDAEI